MKKNLFIILLFIVSSAQAQDTYLNDRVTATDDVIGTARYVGMGGAMGALGADLSVISSNPAGIGLYRKSEVGVTFGAVVPNKANGWNSQDSRTYGEKLPRASFDQLGFVWNMNFDGDMVKYVNFAINYQKKANYNMGFYADNQALRGLSQLDQVAELVTNNFVSDYNLAALAKTPVLNDNTMDTYYLTPGTDGVYRNGYNSVENAYDRHQTGYLASYDFNGSFNVNDRFYTGLTIGLDNVHYNSWSEYGEWASDGGLNHTLYNDREIRGYGVNVKVGFIGRPIADNPLRIGLTVETPTWYRLENDTHFHLDKSDNVSSFLEYTLRTPWRARLSLGSTVDKVLAWGVEYEYANMAKNAMGYPDWPDDGYHNSFSNDKDHYMNRMTKNILRGQHTVKAGLEVKPVDAVALRVGYNYVSKRFRDGAAYDQYELANGDGTGNNYCYAMDYQTSTDYMTLGATNIFTFGVGFKHKRFYADLAYKYRMQTAKFYAFDTAFTTPDGIFAADNPTLSGVSIDPVEVDLNRHQVMCSLGFKF